MPINIGAYNLIKQSKSGICIRKVISSSTIGEPELKFTCPNNKLWSIQQLTAYNGLEPTSRACQFFIGDEIGNFVANLSNDGIAKRVIPVGDAKTYDGFGLTFIPEGWLVGVRWFGITVFGSVSFYAHITEIDLT